MGSKLSEIVVLKGENLACHVFGLSNVSTSPPLVYKEQVSLNFFGAQAYNICLLI